MIVPIVTLLGNLSDTSSDTYKIYRERPSFYTTYLCSIMSQYIPAPPLISSKFIIARLTDHSTQMLLNKTNKIIITVMIINK